MQITGMYRGPSVSIQGENKGMFYSNLSYRHDLLNKKLLEAEARGERNYIEIIEK